MFIDRLQARIEKINSVIVAGFDPKLESFPSFILKDAASKTKTDEDFLYTALFEFHKIALETLAPKIAAIKPNLAFFEQYGIGGLRAFQDILGLASELGVPTIADAKRGDIGSTASAYSSAFLGETSIGNRTIKAFSADALTINPFLGFDTVEVFLNDAIKFNKGIFVLVQTSNPGAKDIQGITSQQSGKTVSHQIAHWIYENSHLLANKNGYSGLGAVVGATYPEEAKILRELMPGSLFLVPGYGAQGGTATSILPNFDQTKRGAIINISRALLSSFSSNEITQDQMISELANKIDHFNSDINTALSGSSNGTTTTRGGA